MQAIQSKILEAERLHGLIDPFVQDLRDWRAEVQRLFDRTRASREGRVLEIAIVTEIEIAREALDWEIQALNAVSVDLADEDGPIQLQLHDLGAAFRSLQRAAELLADIIDDMRADEAGRPIIDGGAA